MFKNISKERAGEIFVLTQMLLQGLMPIVLVSGVKTISPLLFSAITMLIATIFILPFAYKNLAEILNKKVLGYILLISLLITFLPSIMIYEAAQYTSPVNVAIFLQMEALFAFIYSYFLLNEKVTKNKLIGATLILTGSVLILFKENFGINFGDLLVILSAALFPLGSVFSVKALKICSTYTVLFYRSIISGVALFGLSLIFEEQSLSIFRTIQQNWLILIVNGVLIASVSKMLWYEGIKRIELSKAIPLSLTHPAATMIYAVLLLNSFPDKFQLFGLMVTIIGVAFLNRGVKSTKKSPLKTVNSI